MTGGRRGGRKKPNVTIPIAIREELRGNTPPPASPMPAGVLTPADLARLNRYVLLVEDAALRVEVLKGGVRAFQAQLAHAYGLDRPWQWDRTTGYVYLMPQNGHEEQNGDRDDHDPEPPTP